MASVIVALHYMLLVYLNIDFLIVVFFTAGMVQRKPQ